MKQFAVLPVVLNLIKPSGSLNILKVYQAIGRQIKEHPEDAKRFHNFAPDKRIILARGCEGPIEGELHSAQYFHGRQIPTCSSSHAF